MGAALVVFLCVWTIWEEAGIVHGTQMNYFYPPLGPVVLLFLLSTANLAVRRAGFGGLSRAELLLIYCMLVVACGVCSTAWVQFLVPILPGAYYYASRVNRWEELFHRYIPPWLAPSDPEVVRGVFEGLRPEAGIPWEAWTVPLLVWTGFFLGIFWTLLCVALVVERQWVERERLTFPLVYPPVQLARSGAGEPPLFKDRLMWAGFSIPAVFNLLDMLSQYWPVIPRFLLNMQNPLDLGAGLTGRPWDALRPLFIMLYPCLVGLSYFVPLDILFSMWFFLVLFKALAVVGAMAGWREVWPQFPFPSQQGAGAFLAMVVAASWVMLRGTRSKSKSAPGGPPLPLWALLGAVLGFLWLVVWARLCGMSLLPAAIFFLLYFAFMLAMGRAVCQAGAQLPEVEWFYSPNYLMATFAGTRALSPKDWTVASYMWGVTSSYHSLNLPNILQSLKIAHDEGIDRRTLLLSLAVGVLIALPVSYWYMLYAAYRHGGTTLNLWRFGSIARMPFVRLASFLESPQPPQPVEAGLVCGGFLFYLLLSAARLWLPWWPFHPIGYAVATIRLTEIRHWFSFFVAWLLKFAVLRYGGPTVYRRSIPFFIGLILGDFLSAAFVTTVEGLTGVRDHFLFP
ncbi:MAG TPA: hypothetical protein EYP65_07130 [Armatimonadetes bacterium]|nr:hypothetical protein [Armatimonadota bacterium]